MRDYTPIAEKLIKNARWWHVRLRVRRALERAYQDGLNDALDKVTANTSELSDSIRDLGKGGGRTAAPQLRPPQITH